MSRVARTDYSGDRIANLEKKTGDRIAKLERLVMFGHDDRIANLEKQIESIQRDDIDKIDEALEAVGEKMDEVIKGIQDDIKGIKGDLDGMARAHNALKSRVEALENKK